MQRTIRHVFKTKDVISDITGNIPNSFNIKISYAKAEKKVFQEGTMYSQYFSHYLYLIELTTIELHKDLLTTYINEKKRLFLFMMLQGNISFYTNEGIPITEISENTCYATYKRKGKYLFKLLKGKHQFFCIIPRTGWLHRNSENYPSLELFLKSMKNDQKLFGQLSLCSIDKKLNDLLFHLFSLNQDNPIELETLLLINVKAIISQYQLLLDKKHSSRAYIIKDYIDINFADININNKILAELFFTTEKTLIQTFKKEFGTTPHSYLIKKRLERAKDLITLEQMTPTQVYNLVGYLDFQSFSKQFKKYFGLPPSKFM
ncbi:AraC family transcriptional regulator [Sphingobacterium sp. HMA12]|uniref:helix-turn-helix domain-containing protein n=1 Tax=Sphingobacterium sp. HMA12 TaxID=2050894 RepID=UPI000CEA504A|nr:helix-turn-helix domain-containing protein [Sphingobacterium sp. HMA12]